MPDEELVGKTIARIERKTMVGDEIHYHDEVVFDEVTLHFTDGTSFTYAEDSRELWGDTIRPWTEEHTHA